jgi:DNA-binding NtrC family response regulator
VKPRPPSVLVVDDEAKLADRIKRVLAAEGMVAEAETNARTAIAHLERETFDVVVTDLRMPDATGIEVLQAARSRHPATRVFVVTAYGDVSSAVQAMKLGAADFLEKPLDLDDLVKKVKTAGATAVGGPADQGETTEATEAAEAPFVAESAAMRGVTEAAAKVAGRPTTVLLTGESGTGKTRLARWIHGNSPRAAGPFVVVNAAAVPETLLESELFGHEKGAFTGAVQRRVGRFEAAKGGTILLDEIADVPLSLQPKLLRVLQDAEFERVGGAATLKADARVVAATNRNLEDEVEAGRFREDLFYRIKVVEIPVPPLRDRREEIPALVGATLATLAARFGEAPRTVADEAMEILRRYPWPGNVRELANAIEHGVALGAEPVLGLEDLPLTIRRFAEGAKRPARRRR